MEALTTFRVDVQPRRTGGQIPAGGWLCDIEQTGIQSITGGFAARIFFLKGRLALEEVQQLASVLLADPVTEEFAISAPGEAKLPAGFDHTIEVTLLPGVTDPVAESLVWSAHLMGIMALEEAATGQRYLLRGELSERDLRRLALEVFTNPVIQRFEIDCPISAPFVPFQQSDGTVERIALREAQDDELAEISAARRLALSLAEMQAIRAYFRGENREPTDVELETLAQTWSEHCVHKTFKATIHYKGPLPGEKANTAPQDQVIQGLLDTTIRRATEQIAKPWVRSAFVDNAGIIAFTHHWDVAFKVETHNHPSALEPFGGANTGVGGVVRDILGVSARPIANTDVLCFGPYELPDSALPDQTLHPRRVASGVVHGVEDYGNKMGIPTVNGAILYHPDYTANPLVFCGCVGLLPHGAHRAEAQAGDLIVVLGGRTGRDGLRGATFSSMEMDYTTGEAAGSAVQIGHPIHEKQVLEVVLQARDAGLYHAITDCGAGGLSSAVGEMGKHLGVRIDLERVPLKYPGLRPWEIWLSEAQERMVLAVPPECWPAFQAVCALHDCEAVCIGQLEPTGRLRLFYEGQLAGDLGMKFLHDGIPPLSLEAFWTPPSIPAEPLPAARDSVANMLLKLLSHPNIRSKESIIRLYDHEVQGATVVKPLVGAAQHGPSDAAVLRPIDAAGDSEKDHPSPGVALAAGICPAYGEIDPYAMAWGAVDEAMRNLVAVGADPDRVALLDNFCWGNPNLPERLGGLVRCAQGCYDAALAYAAPFISGKDSLNNEFSGADGERHAIPGTLLISALGIAPDIHHTVTMDLKRSGDLLYIVGVTAEELGGSHYHLLHDRAGGQVPQPPGMPLETMRALHQAIRAGSVRACHDCSEGGIGIALAEMCIAGRLGAEIDLRQVPVAIDPDQTLDDLTCLFSESLCRFIVEVDPADRDAFEATLAGVLCGLIGTVAANRSMSVRGLDGENIVSMPVARLEEAWRGSTSPSYESLSEISPQQKTPRISSPAVLTHPPQVCILHARGTNRDREAALACQMAGGAPEIVYVNQLVGGEKHLRDYQMLVIPGGFSYGDDLGAGVLWAMTLRHQLGDDLSRFVADGRPVLGICNGFQVLVKAGLLPGPDFHTGAGSALTLTANESGRFECRWVRLKPNPCCPNLFTQGLDDLIYCPVAHGEGRLIARDQSVLDALCRAELVALTYVNSTGHPADYPDNPNGSSLGIAGLSNRAGNVLGLMPHPEDHIFPWQRPGWHRGSSGMVGLRLFENGLTHI